MAETRDKGLVRVLEREKKKKGFGGERGGEAEMSKPWREGF